MEDKSEPCFGNFLNEATEKCDRLCDKNEQLKCHEEWNRKEKIREKTLKLDVKPEVIQRRYCEKCG